MGGSRRTGRMVTTAALIAAAATVAVAVNATGATGSQSQAAAAAPAVDRVVHPPVAPTAEVSAPVVARPAVAPAATPPKQRVRDRRPELELIGHRAGVQSTPENTMAAVRNAIAVGADAVELDVQFSRDREVVVFHNTTLDKTTDCTGPVAARDLEQLRRCDAGSWFDPSFAGERIPTLDKALRVLRGSDLGIYIHVKVVDDAADARALLDLVERRGMTDRAILFTSDDQILRRLHAAGAGLTSWASSSAPRRGGSRSPTAPSCPTTRPSPRTWSATPRRAGSGWWPSRGT